jgi:hypothetical protein
MKPPMIYTFGLFFKVVFEENLPTTEESIVSIVSVKIFTIISLMQPKVYSKIPQQASIQKF